VNGEMNVFPRLVGELRQVSLHRQQMIRQLVFKGSGRQFAAFALRGLVIR
jgi:hypothetical protein